MTKNYSRSDAVARLKQMSEEKVLDRELTLGEILKSTKIDYNSGPAIVFFVERATEKVSVIAMISQGGASVAKWGSHLQPQNYSYWDYCSKDQLESFLNESLEIWIYDWSYEGEETDFEQDIDWEIEPVQKWVKAEPVTLADIQQLSAFIGYGSGYGVDEVLHYLR